MPRNQRNKKMREFSAHHVASACLTASKDTPQGYQSIASTNCRLFVCSSCNDCVSLSSCVALFYSPYNTHFLHRPHQKSSFGHQITITCSKPAKLPINDPSYTIMMRRRWSIAAIAFRNVPTNPISLRIFLLSHQNEPKANLKCPKCFSHHQQRQTARQELAFWYRTKLFDILLVQ